MAARRASAQFLAILQRSNVSASVQPFAVPRQATALANRRLHSESQAKLDNEHTEEYESNKMTAEGGGNPRYVLSEEETSETKKQVEKHADTAKDTVKDYSKEASETADTAKDTVKDYSKEASETADTAKDTVKDYSKEVSETATGLKEVGVEAVKSIKRDAGKVAEKVGLKPGE